MSRRYQKTPQSQQFMELFRYISGVNQKQEEIEMTRPVVAFHNITRETSLGNYENQTMHGGVRQEVRRVRPDSRRLGQAEGIPGGGYSWTEIQPCRVLHSLLQQPLATI